MMSWWSVASLTETLSDENLMNIHHTRQKPCVTMGHLDKDTGQNEAEEARGAALTFWSGPEAGGGASLVVSRRGSESAACPLSAV